MIIQAERSCQISRLRCGWLDLDLINVKLKIIIWCGGEFACNICVFYIVIFIA